MQLAELQSLKALLASASTIVDDAIANHVSASAPASAPISATIAAAPLPTGAPLPVYQSIYRKIVEVLRRSKPLTHRQLQDRLKPQFTPNQTYRRVLADEDSLVNRGIVILDVSVHPHLLSLAPGYEGDPNPDVETYIAPILGADPTLSADDPLVQAMGRFRKLYTEEVVWPRHAGKGYVSSRFLKGLDARGGLRGLIEHLVMRADQSQLLECCKAGRPDASIEWLVTQNWHLFHDKPDLVARAKANLNAAMAQIL